MSAGRRICPSNMVTTEQVIAIGRKAITDHPEIWDRHPSYVVGSLFLSVFPCGAR